MASKFFPRKCKQIAFYGAGLGAVLGIAKLSFLCTNSFLDSSLNFMTLGVYRSVLCKSTQQSDQSKLDFVESKLHHHEFKLSSPHHTAYAVHSNQIFSNDPGEDRHIMGFDRNRDLSLFAVIDGHGGWQCADVLKHNILNHSMAQLAPDSLNSLTAVDPLVPDSKLNPQDLTPTSSTLHREANSSPAEVQSISQQLSKAFCGLDKSLTDRALAKVHLLRKGHRLDEDALECLMQAISGACALTAYVKGNDLFVASTGDCRAVVGSRSGGGWIPRPLSVDQQDSNLEEVRRVKRAHPGEDSTVIVNGRLMGSLMPLRSFGDVAFKWSPVDLTTLRLPLVANYKTPPYLTAKPVVTHRRISNEDKFVVLATDGLWEKLTNSQVVELVGRFMDEHSSDIVRREEGQQADTVSKSLKRPWFGSKSSEFKESNAATLLMRDALGKDTDSLYEVLSAKPPLSRMVRDDITILVVFLKE